MHETWRYAYNALSEVINLTTQEDFRREQQKAKQGVLIESNGDVFVKPKAEIVSVVKAESLL